MGEDILCVWKCRHPTAINEACVPTTVIRVQMGTEHVINVFGLHTSGRELDEPVFIAARVPPGRFCISLVAAAAGVYENNMVSGPHQVRLNGHHHEAGVWT